MENPSIIIDSSSSKITYNGTLWRQETNSTNTLGGSNYVCAIEGRLKDSEVYVDVGPFLTKGYAVYGTVDDSLELEAYVDKTPYKFVDTTMKEVHGKQGVKVFEAGIVPGRHQLHLEPKQGRFSVDYILYRPIGKTKLDGEDLIFDDANVSFNYTGAWTRITDPDLPQLPFNRTLISTTEPEATLSFPFTGASITVYGAFNRSLTGVVAADFSVDNSASYSLVLNNQTSEQPGWALHQQYFQYNVTENPQDEHILHVTIKDASPSQPFFLDYVIVQGNEHSRIAEKSFQKTGSALKGAGMNIGLSFLVITVILLIAMGWRQYRKRQKAKLQPPNKA